MVSDLDLDKITEIPEEPEEHEESQNFEPPKIDPKALTERSQIQQKTLKIISQGLRNLFKNLKTFWDFYEIMSREGNLTRLNDGFFNSQKASSASWNS